MLDIETETRMVKRGIEKLKQEIESLKSDSLRVRNSRVKDYILTEIHCLERMIERREFKLWKLSK